MAAQGACFNRFCIQPPAERLAVLRLHDGRLRHPLRNPAKGPDASEAQPVASGALSSGGTRRLDRGRGAESLAANAGGNPAADQPGNLYRKIAADRALRTAGTGTKTQSATTPATSPAHHPAGQDAPPHS